MVTQARAEIERRAAMTTAAATKHQRGILKHLEDPDCYIRQRYGRVYELVGSGKRVTVTWATIESMLDKGLLMHDQRARFGRLQVGYFAEVER